MLIIICILSVMLILTFVIKDEVFRSVGRIFFAICCLIAIIAYDVERKNKEFDEGFTNSKSNISIVTKRWKGETLSYYEINDQQEKRTIKKFKYEPNNALYLENCFDSYRIKYNKTNAYMEESCKVLDKDRNLVEYDDTINDIINLISNLEHAILESKIIIVDNDYYVDVAFNVNLWTPYELYKYENSKLKIIYTFNDEEVIYIKETKK